MAKSPLAEFTMPFKKGEVIYADKEPGAEMYLVQSGAVDLYRVIAGQEEILATMEKGDFFGEDSLLDGSPRSTNARVREDAEVIIINGTIFDKMLKGNIEIAFRMMRKMAAKVRQANQMIEQLKLQGGAAGAVGGLGQPTVERRAYVEEAATPPKKVTAAIPVRNPIIAEFFNPETGKQYPVYEDDVVIGRFDPVTQTSPEIDLTAEDPQRSVSRRHAKLIQSNGQFFVAEEVGTLNGTFINGKRIVTGILTQLPDNAMVDFAMVKLIFRDLSLGK